MKLYHYTLAVCVLLLIGSLPAWAGKTIHLPQYIYDGAKRQYFTQTPADYANAKSRFSTRRMKETKNFVFLWESGYGQTAPEKAPAAYRIPMKEIMENMERMYQFYYDSLQFVTPGHTVADRYKMVVFLFHDSQYAAVFGSGSEQVGVMYLYPSRIQKGPYGALAHELGHAFQYMVQADGGTGFRGSMYEMTSQYMLWRYYSNWPTFESYHVGYWLTLSHLAFMHPDNQYHSPFVLEYWADLHGPGFIGQLWRQAQQGDDFVVTYKRICGMTQAQFCDEMFNGDRRFVTWDLKRGNTIQQFANRYQCKLQSLGDGWYQPVSTNMPQDYGFNAIRLDTKDKASVTVDFCGLADDASIQQADKARAGWRYGFVVQKKDGSREYSPIYSQQQAKVSCKVSADVAYLWFVVMGAPKDHQILGQHPAVWPYKISWSSL